MAGPFRGGLARVSEDGKWGYVNRAGEFVIPPRFDMASEFSEGRGLVEVDKKYGYVDSSGNLVIAPAFLHAHEFSEGLASVNTGYPSGESIFHVE